MRKNVLILGHNDATQFLDIYNQYTQVFDKEKFKVTVVFLTCPPKQEVKDRLLAEEVIFLDLPKKDIRTLKIAAINKLLKLCKQHQFQIAVCHRYKPTYIMLWVAQFYRLQALVCVMHELHTMDAFSRKIITACLARKNTVFAGVSNAVRNDMRKALWVDKNKVITLYNMIDVDKTAQQLLSREAARASLNLDNDTFVFGNIARLAPNKDQKNLLHAYSLIKPYCPNSKLIIMGDGTLENELRAQAKNTGLENDVIFTGFVANGFSYMKAFDCFVLNSIQEAFGRVLIEAMVAKLPIIATAVHGIPEVVENVGTLIPPRKSAALANALQEIYQATPENRFASGEAGFKRALDHFSIPKFREQFWQSPVLSSLKE